LCNKGKELHQSKISIGDIARVLDEVGIAANRRKKAIGIASGYSECEMDLYLSDAQYRKSRSRDIGELGLKWFRRRKNQDIKDSFTLEGRRRKLAVRAEKTTGADPEYQSYADQAEFNRFDISWEEYRGSRSFLLAMEVEMSLEHSEVVKDFKKLLQNRSVACKVIVCQAKTSAGAREIASELHTLLGQHTDPAGDFLVSTWTWDIGGFLHFPLHSHNNEIDHLY
jgi:hypothetical protein